MTVIPQWPPIGATSAILAKFECEHHITANQVAANCPTIHADVPMQDFASMPPPPPASQQNDRPLLVLSDSALKQQTNRLQRHLQETPVESFQPLRSKPDSAPHVCTGRAQSLQTPGHTAEQGHGPSSPYLRLAKQSFIQAVHAEKLKTINHGSNSLKTGHSHHTCVSSASCACSSPGCHLTVTVPPPPPCPAEDRGNSAAFPRKTFESLNSWTLRKPPTWTKADRLQRLLHFMPGTRPAPEGWCYQLWCCVGVGGRWGGGGGQSAEGGGCGVAEGGGVVSSFHYQSLLQPLAVHARLRFRCFVTCGCKASELQSFF